MRLRPVEPMHRPPDGDQVDRCARQSSRLSTSLHNLESRTAPREITAGYQHFIVRLDREHAVPGFEKQFGEHPRSRTDVRHHGVLTERVMLTQQGEDVGRKAWP